MSAIVRARIISSVSKGLDKRSYSAAVNTPKQQMAAAAAAFSEELPPPPRTGVGMRLLKYGAIASMAGLFGATGYATYGITKYYLSVAIKN